jgi:hypothetical protein
VHRLSQSPQSLDTFFNVCIKVCRNWTKIYKRGAKITLAPIRKNWSFTARILTTLVSGPRLDVEIWCTESQTARSRSMEITCRCPSVAHNCAEPTLAELSLVEQRFVKNGNYKFYENSGNYLVADTRFQTTGGRDIHTRTHESE